MGGSTDRITILPIDMESKEEAQKMFETIDVSDAKCYLESDQERLLDIIQKGGGEIAMAL